MVDRNRTSDASRPVIPKQQAIALQRLQDAGWLSKDLHLTILRAAKHATNPKRTLAFAIALGHLRRNGVPVIDTIDMLIEGGRPINFGWSARRWQAEHDKLSRIVAARRLVGEHGRDRPFETGWLDDALPPESDPRRSLITVLETPRLMAEEGLRQGHCIGSAGYIKRCRHGVLLGVSVVMPDGARWTVTLRPPGNCVEVYAKAVVEAMHGARNAIPSAEVRSQILETLGPNIAERPPPTTTAASASGPAPAYFGSGSGRFHYMTR